MNLITKIVVVVGCCAVGVMCGYLLLNQHPLQNTHRGTYQENDIKIVHEPSDYELILELNNYYSNPSNLTNFQIAFRINNTIRVIGANGVFVYDYESKDKGGTWTLLRSRNLTKQTDPRILFPVRGS